MWVQVEYWYAGIWLMWVPIGIWLIWLYVGCWYDSIWLTWVHIWYWYGSIWLKWVNVGCWYDTIWLVWVNVGCCYDSIWLIWVHKGQGLVPVCHYVHLYVDGIQSGRAYVVAVVPSRIINGNNNSVSPPSRLLTIRTDRITRMRCFPLIGK